MPRLARITEPIDRNITVSIWDGSADGYAKVAIDQHVQLKYHGNSIELYVSPAGVLTIMTNNPVLIDPAARNVINLITPK